MAMEICEGGQVEVKDQVVFEKEQGDQAPSEENQTEKRLKKGFEGLD